MLRDEIYATALRSPTLRICTGPVPHPLALFRSMIVEGWDITTLVPAISVSNRDPGFNRIVVGADTLCRCTEKASIGQRFNIRVDIAVIAAERLGECPDAGHVVAAHVAQQFHPLPSQDPGKGIPAFKRQVSLVKILSTFSSMPGVDEPPRCIALHRSTNSDFDVAHSAPRNL